MLAARLATRATLGVTLTVAALMRLRRRLFLLGRLSDRFRLGEQALDPSAQLAEQARLRLSRLGRHRRRRLLRGNAFDRGFLALQLRLFMAEVGDHVFFLHFHPLVARRFAGFGQIVVAHAHDLVMRGFQMNVRDQHHVHVQTLFDRMDFGTLFVEQEGGHVHRHLRVNRAGVFLHRLFLDDAQDVQSGGLGAADEADAVTARAGLVAGLAQAGLQALTRELQQAKTGQLAHLHASAVVLQHVAQTVFHVALVLGAFHIDEVDHHQATQVAQAQLAGDFLGRFQVGLDRGVFDVGALGGARGVDVDGHQRFGVIDHDGAARRQLHAARKGGFDLVLDLETGEQRHMILVQLHTRQHVGHHMAHELTGLIVDFLGVDQHFADVRMEIVADRADHQAAFLQNQERRVLSAGRAFNRAPQLHQVTQIPLQFFQIAANAGGAGDQAHAVRHFQLRQQILQLLTLLALNATRYAAAARVVGHQHQVTAGQADIGGQRRTLVAAFVLLHLHDDFHAFAQHVLNARTAAIIALEIGTGHLFKRQEAVAFGAVIDKTSLKGGLDTGNHTLIDIPLALLFAYSLDIEVDELLPVDNGNAQLFSLRCVEQHAFHLHSLRGTHARDAASI